MQLLQCLGIFVVNCMWYSKAKYVKHSQAQESHHANLYISPFFVPNVQRKPALYRFTPHFHLFFAGSFANHRVNGMNGVAIQFFPQRLVNELLTLNQPLALKGIGIHLNGDVTSIGIIIRAGNFHIIGPQRRRDLLRANIDDGLALSGLGRHRPGE